MTLDLIKIKARFQKTSDDIKKEEKRNQKNKTNTVKKPRRKKNQDMIDIYDDLGGPDPFGMGKYWTDGMWVRSDGTVWHDR